MRVGWGVSLCVQLCESVRVSEGGRERGRNCDGERETESDHVADLQGVCEYIGAPMHVGVASSRSHIFTGAPTPSSRDSCNKGSMYLKKGLPKASEQHEKGENNAIKGRGQGNGARLEARVGMLEEQLTCRCEVGVLLDEG